MKTIIKNTVIAVFFMSFLGCNDEYFDVNSRTGTATIDLLKLEDLIGPAIKNTFVVQYYAERTLGNYSQYFTTQGGDAYGRSEISGAWTTFYLNILPELNALIEKSESVNATHFGAVGKILIAANLGVLTDCYDNIPFSEAAKFGAGAAFDSQQDIYASLSTLLTEAISALSSGDPSGYPIKNDRVYGGDASKWLKLAYTLRARYKMHLIGRNGLGEATSALADLQNGFTSNADDFQMTYPSDINNPWYSREVLAVATGNSHDKISDQLVSYMDGKSYPYTTITLDPRLPVYAKITDASGIWRGYDTGGQGLTSDGINSGNTDFSDGGFYTNADAPLVIITYAEAQFIKAEAAFLTNGGSTTSTGTNATAYAAYKAGISASMDKMGVAGAAYLTDASIDLGAGSLRLEHIMKEKYIANFLNPETFVDLRRYNFSTDVFKDFTLPLDHALSEYPGEFMVRTVYPGTEQTRNPDNVNANKQEPTVKVWWNN